MARLVRIEAKGPLKIEPSDKAVWVCACGLSKAFPLCDKSHKACAGEEEGRLYAYGHDGRAREIGAPEQDSPV